MKRLFLCLGLCLLAALANLPAAHAAPAVHGITVSPAITQIDLKPNQNSASFNIQVTNNTLSAIVLNASARDFTTLDLSGSISLSSSPTSGNNPHGLQNYLSLLGYPQIALGPRQSQTVPINIVNADKLAIGGHYAAILFSVAGTPNAKGNRVIINQTVSSLVFLSTAGQGTQTLSLSTPIMGHIQTSFPRSLNAVFSNTGNTQTIPRGYAQILDSSSHVISQGQINIDSSLILPASKRLFVIPLQSSGKQILPGFYTLKIYYHHDGQAAYSVYQQKFLFINAPILIVAGLVIVGLFCLGIYFLLPTSFLYSLRR